MTFHDFSTAPGSRAGLEYPFSWQFSKEERSSEISNINGSPLGRSKYHHFVEYFYWRVDPGGGRVDTFPGKCSFNTPSLFVRELGLRGRGRPSNLCTSSTWTPVDVGDFIMGPFWMIHFFEDEALIYLTSRTNKRKMFTQNRRIREKRGVREHRRILDLWCHSSLQCMVSAPNVQTQFTRWRVNETCWQKKENCIMIRVNRTNKF